MTTAVSQLRENLFALERAEEAAKRLVAAQLAYQGCTLDSPDFEDIRYDLDHAELHWTNIVGPRDFLNLMLLLRVHL